MLFHGSHVAYPMDQPKPKQKKNKKYLTLTFEEGSICRSKCSEYLDKIDRFKLHKRSFLPNESP